MRRPFMVVAALVLVLGVAATAPGAVAATPRASLTDVENDVMCVSCREPLAVAQSPQAESERDFIRTLIAQGMTKAQIEQALVAQYGQAVLGKPPAHGFNLTVYVLPPAILVIGIGILAVTLPRWRRRTREAASVQGTAASAGAARGLDPSDARRLAEDLARHV